MPEHEPQQFRACDVCGRTILGGERVYDYLTSDHDRRLVCILCRDRAEADGWVRADSAAARAHPPVPRRRRGLAAARLRESVARASERIRAPGREEPAPEPRPEPDPGPQPDSRPKPRRRQEAQPPAQPVGERAARRAGPRRPAQKPTAPKRPEAKPASEPAPEREPEPVPRPEPDNPHRRMRRGVEVFNEGELPRMVAGLIRSLGTPQAAVRDGSREPPRAEITIAWELSWYRWDILLQSGEVREAAKGSELSEIEEGAPEWNADVDPEGRVSWREPSS